MSQPQEILIRAPNWAGDLVMATPGFRALRAAYPEARITLHVRPELRPLMEGAPFFDALLPLVSHRRGPAALAREGLALRRRRFDLGVCLPDSFSSALLMRLGGVRRIVGYDVGGRGPLLHVRVAPPARRGARIHVARERHVLGLAEAAGAPPRGTHLELFVTEAEEREARVRLHETGVDPAAPLALLAPGASYGPSKLWPAARFAAVGDALAGAGAAVVVVGSPAERALAGSVAQAMHAPAAVLAGTLGLGALKAVVRRARLLVANDAGARHIAVAFGVPCVVLLGPTSLEKTNLNLERVKVLSTDVSCRPCYLRVCPIDHRCMTRISAEQVITESLPALAADAAQRWTGARLRAWDPQATRARSAA
jgi:heptosyltransferase II